MSKNLHGEHGIKIMNIGSDRFGLDEANHDDIDWYM